MGNYIGEAERVEAGRGLGTRSSKWRCTWPAGVLALQLPWTQKLNKKMTYK